MIYHDFKNVKLSALGFLDRGRLTGKEGQPERSAEEAEALYDLAIKSGINYFEAERDYGRKNPETDAGRILGRYPRTDYYLASGFPGYELEQFEKPEELFLSQLENLQTEYFDFYCLQYVSEINIEQLLDPSVGLMEYFLGQKKSGRIRYLGCSFFGNQDAMRRFLDRYGEHIDFCRFSLNWMDWDYHFAKLKLRICRDYGIPVWASDPLKNGLLESLPAEQAERLSAQRPACSQTEWAYRYLQSFPEASVTLLEPEDLSALQTAVDVFEVEKPLGKEEIQILYEIAKTLYPRKYLNCTGCRRCMKHCIKFLDIAGFMELYNEEVLSGYQPETAMYVKAYPVQKQPQSCCHWGPCQSVCPSKLDIIRMMLPLAARVGRNPYGKK